MNFWGFISGYWWLVFPIGGVVGGWVGGVAKYNEKRRSDKIEMLRLKQGAKTAELHAAAESETRVQRVLGAHDEVTRRWFEYETDLTKLIDFPMMTDMREPLTVDFHRAKVAADALRPDDPAELRQPAVYSEFRDAVHAERVAFDVAEREATRRRRSDFSEAEQDSLARARKLINVAVDSAATPAERQGAYRRARTELDGLIVVPPAASAAMERRIAGVLEAGDPAPPG